MAFPSLSIGDLTAKMPIVQGGMGVGISLSGLASAVANQGGIGVIAGAMIGMKEPDVAKNPIEANLRALRQELTKAREKTQGIIGVNIMVALTTFSQMVRTAIENRADIIFSGAGLPLEMPKHLLQACEEKKEEFKTKLVPIVSSARAATLIARKWLSRFDYLPDAFVVEGPKAGGHLGYKADQIEDEHYSLEEILPPIVEEVHAFEAAHDCHIPVIAGGGVYTGEDIYNILQLGAEGVQMGTRFVATEECDADPAFKESYVHARKEDIEIIQSPVGMPGRAIHSSFLEKVKAGLKRPKSCPFNCIKTCDVSRSPYCIMLALYNAFRGRLENGYAFCGANAWRTEKIQSVRELIASLRKEYESFSLRDRLFPNKG